VAAVSDRTPLVAVFDSSRDTVDMLEEAFRQEGFRTISGHVADVRHGELDFSVFLAQHNPQAIVWDIAPPYAENWTFFQTMIGSKVLHGRGLVLTTTHRGHLDHAAGHHTHAIEIIGKPYDLGQVVSAVKAALPPDDR
jgi:DNA-binding response OmpR family regulator